VRETRLDHRSAVPRLDNPAALDGAYTGEALNLVRRLTGADYVVSLGWMTRRTTADRRARPYRGVGNVGRGTCTHPPRTAKGRR
jgi:hypothetical protein